MDLLPKAKKEIRTKINKYNLFKLKNFCTKLKTINKTEETINNTFITSANGKNNILKLENKSSYALGLTTAAFTIAANKNNVVNNRNVSFVQKDRRIGP